MATNLNGLAEAIAEIGRVNREGADNTGTTEQGTFTPTLIPSSGSFTSETYDIQTGIYIKIGCFVMAQLSVRQDSLTVGSGSGQVRISGLPYANKTGNGTASCSIGFCNGWAGDHPSAAVVQSDGSDILLYHRTAANGGNTATDVTDMRTTANSNHTSLMVIYETNP